jgi:hypothetical protein
MQCSNHSDIAVKIERAENKAESAYSLAKDVHDDHERTKDEITKIKVSFAKASFLGSGLTIIISEAIKFLIAHPTAVKTAIRAVFPEANAGQ